MIMRARPEILRDYERRVSYLIIDEYQDTTPIQDELLTLLSAWYGNLCVVGDSDQTIFAWSNADVRNILNFEKQHTGTKRVNLETNYRSTENILNVANHCIQHNRERIPKTLIAYRRTRGPRVTIHYTDDGIGANYICDMIKELLTKGRDPDEIAVLTKTNDQLAEILTEMQKRGIPAKAAEAEAQFKNNPKVKRILTAMEQTANERPNLSAYGVYADLLAAMKIEAVPTTFDDFIREFDQNSEDNSCQAFVNLVNAVSSQDARFAKSKAVRLMTIHKAKGLEYRTVFVTFMKSGSFPRYDVYIEEERRVFYVALTRAIDELHVISSQTRRSRFVREIESTAAIQQSGESPNADDLGLKTHRYEEQRAPRARQLHETQPAIQQIAAANYNELYDENSSEERQQNIRDFRNDTLEVGRSVSENGLDSDKSAYIKEQGTCRFCGKTILFGSLIEHETKCREH